MTKRTQAAADALRRLTTPIRSIRPDGEAPFYEDPSDLAAHLEAVIHDMEEGLPADHERVRGLLKTMLPHLEAEAVARLKTQTGARPVVEPDAEHEPDLWRQKWVVEAQFVRQHHMSQTHIGNGAARVLLACAGLRNAIEDRHSAELVAARAMLLACEVFMAGSFMDTQVLVMNLRKQDDAEREHVRKTIGGEHGDMERARVACIKKAADLWKVDPSIRMQEMSEDLEKWLYQLLDKLPALDLPPKAVTIREWLKQADKDGKLTIPEAASKPGAPRKK